MLSCQECERYIPVFLDHALEVKESLDVQAHLQSCFSCHDRAESERRLRMFVRQFLDVPPPQRSSNAPLSCVPCRMNGGVGGGRTCLSPCAYATSLWGWPQRRSWRWWSMVSYPTSGQTPISRKWSVRHPWPM